MEQDLGFDVKKTGLVLGEQSDALIYFSKLLKNGSNYLQGWVMFGISP
jgi:hypothetical protein